MFWQRKFYQHPEFKLGMHDLAPQAFGQIAWALMTGVALVKSGMSVFEAVFMTLLVYAGSSQLAATPLIVAGAPAWVVLAAGFCVNLRFVVFSLHMRGYLMHLPRWPRLVTGYSPRILFMSCSPAVLRILPTPTNSVSRKKLTWPV
jgi:predicted branched-subunit amino acid permease